MAMKGGHIAVPPFVISKKEGGGYTVKRTARIMNESNIKKLSVATV